MKHKGKGGKKKSSICEASMVLVANIIRLSSLPLANISTFGATIRSLHQAPETAALNVASDRKIRHGGIPNHQRSRRPVKRPQEPENEAKPFSVVKKVPIPENSTAAPHPTTTTTTTTTNTTTTTTTTNSTPTPYVTNERQEVDDVNRRSTNFIRKVREKINQKDHQVMNTGPTTTTSTTASSKLST